MKLGVGTIFTGSALFNTFSSMAISLIALNFIGPEKMGLWTAALILKPYVGLSQLGLTQGLGRELPFYMGKNRIEKVEKYVANAQSVTISYSIVFLIITFFSIIFIASSIEEKFVFLTAGIFISTMFVDNYLSSTYRSSKSFKDLSKVYIYSSILSLILIPFIFYFEFLGYMVLLFVHSAISTALLVYFRPFKLKSKFNFSIYKATIKTGFPMLTLNFLRSIPDTYPKILILFFISTTALGLTAPANATLMAFGVLPTALAKYLYPTITYQYGKDGNRLKIWIKIKQIGGYLFLLGIAGLISLTIIPYAIETFFPKYIASINIAMIAVGIGFLRMYSILYNVFNTLKSYNEQFKVSMTRNILYLGIPSLLFFLQIGNNDLEIIFTGILIAEFLYIITMMYYLYKVTHNKSA